MKRLTKLTTILALGMAFVSCNPLTLPDNWIDINFENSPFMQDAERIDPEQSWNYARDGYTAEGMLVKEIPEEELLDPSTVPESVASLNSAVTKSAATAAEAEYYRTPESTFKVSIEEVNADATSITVGVYYYDANGNKVETPLFSNFTKKKYSKNAQEITIRNGDMFGFYIETTVNKVNTKYYSESKLNSDERTHTKHEVKEGWAWWIIIPYRTNFSYIYMEDSANGDYDYDDVVLKISEVLTPLDYDRGPWTLICEDLGGTADNDFNDTVMRIHRTSKTTIDIELVAAGASIKDYIYFNGEPIGEQHQLFGVNDFNILINTKKDHGHDYPTRHISKTVSESYTVSDVDMGGFMIHNGYFDSIRYDFNQTGKVPFMICVPGDFKYPIEGASIFRAYPQFADWARNHNNNKLWYKHPVDSLIIH